MIVVLRKRSESLGSSVIAVKCTVISIVMMMVKMAVVLVLVT